MSESAASPNYANEVLFGAFITPVNSDPGRVVGLTKTAETAGLDLATFQDHPYQATFLDTWTLMSYIAAQTTTIKLSANVLNLPLRPPAVLARAAASLDLLSGGRLELGLGAGAFWDAVEAMGGRRLTAGQSVTALTEAIDIIRGIWDTDNTSRLAIRGEFYQAEGVKRGPKPAHDIGIWLGAYKPRMLRLSGEKADGWLPSLGYLKDLNDLSQANEIIDEAAQSAGRPASAIRRLLNINGSFGERSEKLLTGPPQQWVEQLAAITLDYGMDAYILGSDDPRMLTVFGQEIAPAVRELVAAERRGN